MQLSTFTERTTIEGDWLKAQDAVDRPLVVLVREHRTGVKTKYTPEGGDAVLVDVALVATNDAFVGVLWMNGAVVDNLSPYVGQAVAVKLCWTPSTKGGNAYIGIKALDGAEAALAAQWAAANPNRFEAERVHRAQQQQAQQQAAASAPQQLPGAPAAPPAWAQPPAPPAPAAHAQAQPAAPTIPATAPAPPPAPAPAPAPALNANSPEVQALLAAIANQQQPPPAP